MNELIIYKSISAILFMIIGLSVCRHIDTRKSSFIGGSIKLVAIFATAPLFLFISVFTINKDTKDDS